MRARRSETDALIEHEIRIPAAPQIVFAYFADPVKTVPRIGRFSSVRGSPFCSYSLYKGLLQ